MENHQSVSVTLELTGKPIGQRFEAIVSGKSVALSGTSFFYLFQLVFYAITRPGTWVPRENIEDTDNQAKYIYRLRKELEAHNPILGELFENNRRGCYRLSQRSVAYRIVKESAANHPDVRIRGKVKSLHQYSSVDIISIS